VPNIKKVYVQRNAAHFHYFYATNNPPTPSNYYTIGAPWQYPDDVKVMTSVTPIK
jgi:hypothetical protein